MAAQHGSHGSIAPKSPVLRQTSTSLQPFPQQTQDPIRIHIRNTDFKAGHFWPQLPCLGLVPPDLVLPYPKIGLKSLRLVPLFLHIWRLILV
jgi:hypothetical protein